MAYHYIERGDTLVMDGMEVDADCVAVMVQPKNRLLWAFVLRNGKIQPVGYDESKVLWLTEEDYAKGI